MKNESGKLNIITLFFMLLIIIIIVLLFSVVILVNINRKQEAEIKNLNDTIQTVEAQLSEAESKLKTVSSIIGNDNSNESKNTTDGNTFSID